MKNELHYYYLSICIGNICFPEKGFKVYCVEENKHTAIIFYIDSPFFCGFIFLSHKKRHTFPEMV
ncbi:MAG TPA: hypothetical protein DCK76_02395 [Desulfotomaculum sp.]|nr:hypothetical protein [Desulfotomaculum sp.]HBY04310.1 hypothetical protein [Desulfotomaculum sp.]